MIGEPVLWKIIRPNFFFPAARPNLGSTMGRVFRFFFALFLFQKPGTHDGQRFLFILLLAPPVLTTHNPAGGDMEDLHSRIGRIYPLPTRTSRSANFNS